MRLHVLSDLHLEFSSYPYIDPPHDQVDVVVLAGDIDNGTRGVEWAINRFPDHPVIYVPGNHEYYGQPSITQALYDMREEAKGTNVHVLDNDAIVIDGVRFLGSTLWTDFRLFGYIGEVVARLGAPSIIRDFQAIGEFDLREWDERHVKSRAFLDEYLALKHDGATVVVTHHAPHRESMHDMYANDPMSPAFVSHLPELVGQADLWVHGHVHTSSLYQPRDCQGMHVACNPRGLALRDTPLINENLDFESSLILIS